MTETECPVEAVFSPDAGDDEDATPDPARELGRRRAAELFAESPEWLGI